MSAPVEVAPVSSAAELGAFIEFPWRIYAGHSNWTPPQTTEIRRLLDERRHPFWQTARRELFLARRGEQIVGRIAAIVDHHHNRRHGEQAGAFGFFECRDDREAAADLFSAAENWLRDRGLTHVRGPFSPSLNYESGLLIEGHPYPSTRNTPYQPQYYQRLVEGCGYTKEKDLLALLLRKQDRPNLRLLKAAAQVCRQGEYRIHCGDMRRFEEELQLARKLCDAPAQGDWNCAPMTENETAEWARNLRRIVDSNTMLFFHRGDEPVGVCLLAADDASLRRRFAGASGWFGVIRRFGRRREPHGLRSVLIGFKPEHAQRGPMLLAYERLHQALRASPKHEFLELASFSEDNRDAIDFSFEIGARPYKRMRIYRKALAR